MTRLFLIVALILFLAMIFLFVSGFSSNAPGALIVGLLLAGPGAVFCLGFALGRASNEFAIVRKSEGSPNGQVMRPARVRRGEPLS